MVSNIASKMVVNLTCFCKDVTEVDFLVISFANPFVQLPSA